MHAHGTRNKRTFEQTKLELPAPGTRHKVLSTSPSNTSLPTTLRRLNSTARTEIEGCSFLPVVRSDCLMFCIVQWHDVGEDDSIVNPLAIVGRRGFAVLLKKGTVRHLETTIH